MKKLVIYYSFEGNTEFIAKSVADECGADILELKPKKDIKTKGAIKYILGGAQATFKTKPELSPLEKNPDDYDVLFIGTPVWAWSFAPALNSFLSSSNIKGKKIALFCCSGGSSGKTMEDFKKALPGNEFLGESEYLNPLHTDKKGAEEKAREWARHILSCVS